MDVPSERIVPSLDMENSKLARESKSSRLAPDSESVLPVGDVELVYADAARVGGVVSPVDGSAGTVTDVTPDVPARTAPYGIFQEMSYVPASQSDGMGTAQWSVS